METNYMDVLVFKVVFLLAERMQLQTHNIIFYTISLISFCLTMLNT